MAQVQLPKLKRPKTNNQKLLAIAVVVLCCSIDKLWPSFGVAIYWTKRLLLLLYLFLQASASICFHYESASLFWLEEVAISISISIAIAIAIVDWWEARRDRIRQVTWRTHLVCYSRLLLLPTSADFVAYFSTCPPKPCDDDDDDDNDWPHRVYVRPSDIMANHNQDADWGF